MKLLLNRLKACVRLLKSDNYLLTTMSNKGQIIANTNCSDCKCVEMSRSVIDYAYSMNTINSQITEALNKKLD